MADTAVKDPSHIARGQLGARTRWGAPRVVRLDELTGPQRDLVMALINNMKAAPAGEVPEAAEREGSRNAAPAA